MKLSITSLAVGGEGVGRDDNGRVVFVPRTAPGDVVEVSLEKEKKSFARGRVLTLLEASEVRVEAPCKSFREQECGGCQWLHVHVDAQRKAKEELVQNSLRKLFAQDMQWHGVIAIEPDLGWRRRARLSYYGQGRTLYLGFRAQRSHQIASTRECPQLSPALGRALALLHREGRGQLRGRGEIHLLEGEGGRVHMALDGKAPKEWLSKVAGSEPLVGVWCEGNDYGEASVELEEGMSARAMDFVQASRSGNLALRQWVDTLLPSMEGQRVWELYAGSGNFTPSLRTAAELDVVDTHTSLKSEERLRVHRLSVEDFVVKNAGVEQIVDGVLMDPPRTGAKDVMVPLASIGPRWLVYVSCDLATLARDADVLMKGGYRPQKAVALDIMPQTSHIETIVRFAKVS